MWPLSDKRSAGIFPTITYLIIVLNIVVFFLEITVPDPDKFINTYALIPSTVIIGNIKSLIPFVTSQFLHAGFFHIISNMWFLKIFGDNVEEEFGSVKFLLIYVLAGVMGGLSQYLLAPNSDIPMLGASGAVAGVLGAYYVFFPDHKIKTLVLGFGFITKADIPASFMLLYWFITQVFSGVGSIAVAATGGIAWFAHIGGFTTGYMIAQIFEGINVVQVEEDETLNDY